MKRLIFKLIAIFTVVISATSCGGHRTDIVQSDGGDAVEMSYAKILTIERCDGGYTIASIRNPWDTTRLLQRYIIVADSALSTASLPEGTVVRVPLRNSLVYSAVHQSLISELGAAEAIGGVCDSKYIQDPALLQRIADGDVVDCGSNYTPDIEKIIALSPDAILLSPYENSGTYGKIGTMGIPLIECADYMESSPLGRMEWVKFFGLLFGTDDEAERLFATVESEYNGLKSLVDSVGGKRPQVLMDLIYGNTWYVPTANSTMGVLIADAGGINPFDRSGKAGSAGLAGEQVLHEAGDADLWLLRYSQTADKTIAELAGDNPVYSQFQALKSGQVYGCNLEKANYFEETPFHPHLILRDLIKIFHPDIEVGGELRYFSRLNP